MSRFLDTGLLGKIRTPSTHVNSVDLVAGVSESQELPAGYNYLQIRSTRDVYVKFGSDSVTAAVPTDTTDGSASELNGGTWALTGVYTHISLISQYDCKATLSFYTIK